MTATAVRPPSPQPVRQSRAAALQQLLAGCAQVHEPLAHWARLRPHAAALADEHQTLSFRQLHQRVQQHAALLDAQRAPHTVLLDGALDTAWTLVQFLGTTASGRCAAVGDAAWPAPVARSVQAAIAALPAPAPQADPGLAPFYVGFTSGSSGQPKGFRRHHRSWMESFRVSLQDFGDAAGARVLAPGRMAHSLFLFGAMLGLASGAGAVVQAQFSAERMLHDLAQTEVLVAVPSQLIVMLQLARRRGQAPLPGVRLVLISGARWMREHTAALRQLLPNARIVEFYGASEASYITWMHSGAHAPAQAVGRAFSNVELRIGDDPHAPLPIGAPGRIWMHSPMLFIDYVHAHDGSAALQQDGWLSVRDVGWLDADGLLHLCGRESRMLVTQGKNLFAEEVEARLLDHPAVTQASVTGAADALRGTRVHAIIAAAPSQVLPGAPELARWCRDALEAYKAPRHWWCWSGPWPLTPSGKTDHAALARALAQHLAQPQGGGPLQPLPRQDGA
ncbi:long-chain fatty acid--CoA ligase [Comamonas faecalis]|uniref:Long-chain fatty acid--CoA ligase n=1 Tax=Comamonas faecalis TaxID=1387849 RepID=A0ABP7QR63_9BURK